ERIEGRARRTSDGETEIDLALEDTARDAASQAEPDDRDPGWAPGHSNQPLTDDSLVAAKQQLAEAVEDLIDVLKAPALLGTIADTDRSNLAKYLTIAKLRLENAIAMVRSGEGHDRV